MPKITAPTVREHHEKVLRQLVDSAEALLRIDGSTKLTAGAVAEPVGIARNSIYRYVKNVEELRMLVLDRYLPQWTLTLKNRIDPSASAAERIIALAQGCLDVAQKTGHLWLISVMKAARSEEHTGNSIMRRDVLVTPAIQDFHETLTGSVHRLWHEISPESARVKASLSLAMIEHSMELLDAHRSDRVPASREDVETALITALRALMV